jgi:hypothetical protein
MASFTIQLSSDPKWLHVARASALAGVSTMPTAHVDFLDDAVLAIGESVLEVAVTPGVEALTVDVATSPERFEVVVEGSGANIDGADVGTGLFAMVMEGLAAGGMQEATPTTYTVRFGMSAPGPTELPLTT